jgi:hypothetical protein
MRLKVKSSVDLVSRVIIYAYACVITRNVISRAWRGSRRGMYSNLGLGRGLR